MTSTIISLDITRIFPPNFNFQDIDRLGRILSELTALLSNLFPQPQAPPQQVPSQLSNNTSNVVNNNNNPPAPIPKQHRQHIRKQAILLYNICTGQSLIPPIFKAELLYIVTQFLLFSIQLTPDTLTNPTHMKLPQQTAGLLLQAYVRTITTVLQLPAHQRRQETPDQPQQHPQQQQQANESTTITQTSIIPYQLFTTQAFPLLVQQCDILTLVTQNPDILLYTFKVGFEASVDAEQYHFAYDFIQGVAYIIYLLSPKRHLTTPPVQLASVIHSVVNITKNTSSSSTSTTTTTTTTKDITITMNDHDETTPMKSSNTTPAIVSAQVQLFREALSNRKETPRAPNLLNIGTSFIPEAEAVNAIASLYQSIVEFMKTRQYLLAIQWLLLAISLVPFSSPVSTQSGVKPKSSSSQPQSSSLLSIKKHTTMSEENDLDESKDNSHDLTTSSQPQTQSTIIDPNKRREAKLYFLLSVCLFELNLNQFASAAIKESLKIASNPQSLFFQCKVLLTLLQPDLPIPNNTAIDSKYQSQHNITNSPTISAAVSLSEVLFPTVNNSISSRSKTQECLITDPQPIFNTIYLSLSQLSFDSVEMSCSILASIPSLSTLPKGPQLATSFATQLYNLFISKFQQVPASSTNSTTNSTDNTTMCTAINNNASNTSTNTTTTTTSKSTLIQKQPILLINHCYLSWLLEHNHLPLTLGWIKTTPLLSDRSMELIASVISGLFQQEIYDQSVEWSQAFLDLIQPNDFHNLIIINLILAQSFRRLGLHQQSIQTGLTILNLITTAKNEGFVPPPIIHNKNKTGHNSTSSASLDNLDDSTLDNFEMRALIVMINSHLALRQTDEALEHILSLLDLVPPIDSLCLLIGEVQTLLTSSTLPKSSQDQLEPLQIKLLSYVITNFQNSTMDNHNHSHTTNGNNKPRNLNGMKISLVLALIKLQTRELLRESHRASTDDQKDAEKLEASKVTISSSIVDILHTSELLLTTQTPKSSQLLGDILSHFSDEDFNFDLDNDSSGENAEKKMEKNNLIVQLEKSLSLHISVENWVTLSQCLWNTILIAFSYKLWYPAYQLIIKYIITIILAQHKVDLYHSLCADLKDQSNTPTTTNTTDHEALVHDIHKNDQILTTLLANTVFKSKSSCIDSVLHSLLLLITSLEVCYSDNSLASPSAIKKKTASISNLDMIDEDDNDSDIDDDNDDLQLPLLPQQSKALTVPDVNPFPFTTNKAIEMAIDVCNTFETIFSATKGQFHSPPIADLLHNQTKDSNTHYFLFVTLKLRCFLRSSISLYPLFFPSNHQTTSFRRNVLSLVPQNVSLETYDCLLSESIQAQNYRLAVILFEDRLDRTPINYQTNFPQVVTLSLQLFLITKHLINQGVDPFPHINDKDNDLIVDNSTMGDHEEKTLFFKQSPPLRLASKFSNTCTKYLTSLAIALPPSDSTTSNIIPRMHNDQNNRNDKNTIVVPTQTQQKFLEEHLRSVINLNESHSIVKVIFNEGVSLFYQQADPRLCQEFFTLVERLRLTLLIKPFSLLTASENPQRLVEYLVQENNNAEDNIDGENMNYNQMKARANVNVASNKEPLPQSTDPFDHAQTFQFGNCTFLLLDFDHRDRNTMLHAISTLRAIPQRD